MAKSEILISKFEIHPPQAGKNSNTKCPNDKNKIIIVMPVRLLFGAFEFGALFIVSKPGTRAKAWGVCTQCRQFRISYFGFRAFSFLNGA
ncbi:MAG: hypothetical protein V1758_07810, partial [Pseudomonadota bacterium]